MEREMEKHIEEKQFEAYAMNQLGGSELASVEEHLLFCETCQDKLEAVERYVLAMRSAATRIRKEDLEAQEVFGLLPRLRGLLHSPVPLFFGAAALAVVLLTVSFPHRQLPGAPVDVELQAVRGESSQTVVAGHALRLRLDNEGVRYRPDWRIEIVDSEGAKLWSGTGNWSNTGITAMVPKSFTPGTYYVRLLEEKQEPAREYQLVVR